MSAQDHARIRKDQGNKPEGGNNSDALPVPQLPAPAEGPELDPEEEEEALVETEKVEPTSTDITKQKHCFKLALSDSNRKFAFRTYGSVAITLFACEEFRKLARKCIFDFQSFKKKPDDRRKLLKDVGCDEKTLAVKTSIANQERALVQRLCDGKVSHIEKAVLNKIMEKLGYGMDLTRIAMKATEKGWVATYDGNETKLEQSFASLEKGFCWLKELVMADKVRG